VRRVRRHLRLVDRDGRATMTRVAYPSMRDHGYSDELSAGAIASGGTLGILIPPSTIMVIYGIMTETSIGKLFAAGVLPGLLATALLCAAVRYITWRDPKPGPPAERSTLARAPSGQKDVWAVAALFSLVMGGIYGGVFTATEGAGIGAVRRVLLRARAARVSTGERCSTCSIESARTTAMLFMILVGALVFANFVNYTSMPDLKASRQPLRDQPDGR
jgi:tripartite ATP-independent transporter DctM subunit